MLQRRLQQLCIVRALLGDPAVVLFDGPTRSLDADARGRFWGRSTGVPP